MKDGIVVGLAIAGVVVGVLSHNWSAVVWALVAGIGHVRLALADKK